MSRKDEIVAAAIDQLNESVVKGVALLVTAIAASLSKEQADKLIAAVESFQGGDR